MQISNYNSISEVSQKPKNTYVLFNRLTYSWPTHFKPKYKRHDLSVVKEHGKHSLT